jgi:Family of unknown function (DUF6526)
MDTIETWGRATRAFATIGAQREEKAMAEQNFANHGKIVPIFHFFAIPVFVINFVWSLFRLRQLEFSFAGIFGVVLAAALVVLVFEARLFALAVQDRVIRLEERLRYERVLPAELQARCGELTINQIVALRFACDAELPALARKVLDEKLTGRKAIKRLIKIWKPDYQRA